MKSLTPVRFTISGSLYFLILFFLISGCTTTKQYAKLADSGSTYTGAVVSMADKASEIWVDASSYKLLAKRSDLLQRYKGGELNNRLNDELQKSRAEDSTVIGQHKVIKAVAGNLQDYFSALKALAASSAPADIGTKTNDVIIKINALIKEEDDKLPLSVTKGAALVSPAMELVTEARLKDEMVSRKNTILSALQVIRKLQTNIAQSIEAYSPYINSKYEQIHVTSPYTEISRKRLSQSSDIDLWIKERQQVVRGLQSAGTASQINDEANKSLKAFRDTFEKMTSGESDGLDWNQLSVLADQMIEFKEFIKSL